MTYFEFQALDLQLSTEGREMKTEPFVELNLESQIDWQVHVLATATTPEERKAAWSQLKRLHAMRTPERVAEMEREAGLAG